MSNDNYSPVAGHILWGGLIAVFIIFVFLAGRISLRSFRETKSVSIQIDGTEYRCKGVINE